METKNNRCFLITKLCKLILIVNKRISICLIRQDKNEHIPSEVLKRLEINLKDTTKNKHLQNEKIS